MARPLQWARVICCKFFHAARCSSQSCEKFYDYILLVLMFFSYARELLAERFHAYLSLTTDILSSYTQLVVLPYLRAVRDISDVHRFGHYFATI